jgi:hypothetical protein
LRRWILRGDAELAGLVLHCTSTFTTRAGSFQSIDDVAEIRRSFRSEEFAEGERLRAHL